jgi:hypothetical protein
MFEDFATTAPPQSVTMRQERRTPIRANSQPAPKGVATTIALHHPNYRLMNDSASRPVQRKMPNPPNRSSALRFLSDGYG